MADIYPLQVLLASLSGWMNRQQGEVLEYLIEENRVLKEQRKGRPLRLTDDQPEAARSERETHRQASPDEGRDHRDPRYGPSLASPSSRGEVDLQEETV